MRSHLPAFNTRVLTVFLVVALPVLLIGAAIVIGIGQVRLRDAQSRELAQMAEYTAGAVDAYVFRRILDASLLARVPDVRRAAADGNAKSFDLQRVQEMDRQWQKDGADSAAQSGILATPASVFLADLVSNDSVYREVLVTDLKGRLVAASNITSDYYQADEQWWRNAFDNGRGRVGVTDVERDQSANVYAFEIAVPVYAPGRNELAGIMKVVADSREMLAGIAGLELGATSEAVLIRPDGSIVFRRRPHTDTDRFFAAELLRQRLDERAARQEPAGPMTLVAKTPEGTERVVALAPSQLAQSYPELPWMVALSIDRDELRAPFQSLLAYLILVFALTGVAVLAIALWVSQRLAAPVTDPAVDMHLVDHPALPRMETGGPQA